MSLLERIVESGIAGVVAEGDAAVERLLRQQPNLPATAFLAPMKGLVACEANFPLSAPEIVRRLIGRYGEVAVRRLRAADARVMLAIERAAEVRARLDDELDSFPVRTREVGRLVVEAARTDHELGHGHVLAALALSDDADPAGRLDDIEPPPSSLATLGELLWDEAFTSPADRAVRIGWAARDAQQAADARVAGGARGVGAVVADDDAGNAVTTTAVLAPLAGTEDENLAIAQARLAGQATAVLRIAGICYAYALSEDWTYADVRAPNPIAATTLTDAGSSDVRALTTREGHVLLVARGGRYVAPLGLPHRSPYLGFDYPQHDPAAYVQADLTLAELQSRDPDAFGGEVFRSELALPAIFAQLSLDYTMARLAQAQRALHVEIRKFAPPDRLPSVSPEAGAALKTASAGLRQAMSEAAILAADLLDRRPSSLERDRAVRLTARIGELMTAEPMALFFVQNTVEEHERPKDADFTDLLASDSDGDAAIRAAAEAATRNDNVETIRLHLMTHHPEAARGLGAVHPNVIEAFSPDQQRRLELAELGEALRALAIAVSLALPGVLALMFGVIPGLGVAALAAAGLSAAIGLSQVPEGFERAEQLTAMAACDVPGGFQLAAAEDASSARRWAWIGLGLSLLDLVLLRADLVRVLREAATGRAAASGAGTIRTATPGITATVGFSVRAIGGVAVTEAASEAALEAAALANRERLASRAFKELSAELRVPQRQLRALISTALDETSRLAAVAALRRAAADLLKGGRAKGVAVGAALRPAESASTTVRTSSRLREFLVVGESEAGLGWGVEQLAAGRRTTAVASTRTGAVDTFVSKNGSFVQGGIADLPSGYQCTVAREDLLQPGTLPDLDAFVRVRAERLRPGGQWMVATESRELATGLAKTGPRPGLRIWTTEYTTFRQGRSITRYVAVIAKPRPTTMTAVSSLIQPGSLTPARLSALTAELAKPGNLTRLQRKLADAWHRGIVVEGQIAEWQLKNLVGNIAEILSDGYQSAVLAARRAVAETAEAKLFTGVRRLDGGGFSKEFTDNLIAIEREGNAYVIDVFEVKGGPRGGQEAATQLFEWMENELEVGDRIILGGKDYVYSPGSTAKGQIIGLGRARRHIVAPKGAELSGLRTADTTAALTVRAPLSFAGAEVNAAEIRYLARRVVDALPPAP